MTKLNIIFFLIIAGISFSVVYLSQEEKNTATVKSEINIIDEDLVNSPENQFQKMLDYLELRIKRRPSDHSNYNELAIAYITKSRETGDLNYYIKAEDLLEKSLELKPDNYSANLYIGLIKQAKHDFQSSIQYLEKAIDLSPNEAFAYGVLGDAYLELGNTSRAKTLYKKMHELRPSLDSYGRLSNLKFSKGDFDSALEDMKSAFNIGIKDSNSKENLAWCQVMIGSIYFEKQNYEEAESHYNKSLKIVDEYYLALLKLGELYEKKKNYEEAEKFYLKVTELNSRADVEHTLSHLYRKMDKPSLAKKHENNARELSEQYKALGFEELHTHSHSHSH